MSDETSVKNETQPSLTTVFGRRVARESGVVALTFTEAFILRVDPLSEKDVAATFLTKEKGLVRAAVKGARGRSKKGAALQLLTEVSVSLFHKEGADLSRADALEIRRSAFPLAQDPNAAMLLPYLAESVVVFVPEHEPGGEVFRLLRHVLDALEAGVDSSLSARYFEVWLLRLSGLFPDERACAACGEAFADGAVAFAAEVPGFAHVECAPRGAIAVAEEVRDLVSRIRKSKLTSLSASRPAPRVLEGVEGLAREVRRRFLGHELKSYRFLRSLA